MKDDTRGMVVLKDSTLLLMSFRLPEFGEDSPYTAPRAHCVIQLLTINALLPSSSSSAHVDPHKYDEHTSTRTRFMTNALDQL